MQRGKGDKRPGGGVAPSCLMRNMSACGQVYFVTTVHPAEMDLLFCD